MNDSDTRLLVLILAGAMIAGAAWYFWDDIRPSTDEIGVEKSGPATTVEVVPKDPLHPIDASISPESANENLVPLPQLDESDAYFLLALADIFGDDIERLLTNEALIDKFVASIDNLTRDHVAEKVRPVNSLGGAFTVDAAATDGPYFLGAENYARYDLLVNVIAAADVEEAVSTYRRFYPLFQESYERLGYPNAYFNDRVVEVIDHLIQTPEPNEPILLVQPHVLYEFADPELEKLSSGQKLLLRMGSDHAARIKGVLAALRAQVTAQ